MNIKDIKKGMKLKSKINNLVDFYIVCKVKKSVIWVIADDNNTIFKNIKPYMMKEY
jgi:hypothetical protein